MAEEAAVSRRLSTLPIFRLLQVFLFPLQAERVVLEEASHREPQAHQAVIPISAPDRLGHLFELVAVGVEHLDLQQAQLAVAAAAAAAQSLPGLSEQARTSQAADLRVPRQQQASAVKVALVALQSAAATQNMAGAAAADRWMRVALQTGTTAGVRFTAQAAVGLAVDWPQAQDREPEAQAARARAIRLEAVEQAVQAVMLAALAQPEEQR